MCLLCALALFFLWRSGYAPLAFTLAALYGMVRMRLAYSVDPSALQALLSPVAAMLYGVRDRLLSITDLLFYDAAPLLRGVLWGDTAYIAQVDTQAFRVAGIGHILALSGLHVSFFAGALRFLVPPKRPRLRFYLTGAFLLCYCAVAAFPPSLVRASVMTLCFLGADVRQRRADVPCAMALAALLILLCAPKALFDVGFQLSFGAVAGIALLLPPLSRLCQTLPKAFSQSACVSLSATCGTLPLSACYFGRVPLYSLAANLLILPLLPLSILPAFIAVLVYPLSPLIARTPAFIAYHIMALIRGASRFFSLLPCGLLTLTLRPDGMFCALCYALMLLCSDYVLRNGRYKRTGALFILLLMLFYAFYATIGA